MKRATVYNRETLIGVIKSYQRMIERSGKDFPTVVLSDLTASMGYVLKKCEEEDAHK